MEGVDELTPELERRLRQAAKILAAGAIRVAAKAEKLCVDGTQPTLKGGRESRSVADPNSPVPQAKARSGRKG